MRHQDEKNGAGYGDCTRLFESMRSATSDQQAFRLSVRDWMTGYNNEVDKFPSLALFLEMKLLSAKHLLRSEIRLVE